MIVVLYRWKIKSGKEKQFEDNWSIVTKAIREECGSYGSRLHFSENNEYVGYAQWPNVETRDSCQLHSPSSADSMRLMKEAIEHSYPDQILEIKSDLLEDYVSDE